MSFSSSERVTLPITDVLQGSPWHVQACCSCSLQEFHLPCCTDGLQKFHLPCCTERKHVMSFSSSASVKVPPTTVSAPQGTWQLLNTSSWSEAQQQVLAVYIPRRRQDMAQLLSRAYSCISPQKAGSLLNLPEAQAATCMPPQHPHIPLLNAPQQYGPTAAASCGIGVTGMYLPVSQQLTAWGQSTWQQPVSLKFRAQNCAP